MGLEGLYIDAPFENVVPEFGTCGTDTMDTPSLAQDDKEECKDCYCKPIKEPPILPTDKLCFKCKEQRATIKIKKEPSCNECF